MVHQFQSTYRLLGWEREDAKALKGHQLRGEIPSEDQHSDQRRRTPQ